MLLESIFKSVAVNSLSLRLILDDILIFSLGITQERKLRLMIFAKSLTEPELLLIVNVKLPWSSS